MNVDLNCDVGEGYDDAAVLAHVTSANVACGAHAGDEGVMRATVAAALARGVAIGAHPSYPDRAGFGRREVPLSPTEIGATVTTQVTLLGRIAAEAGAVVAHVKPHGALYHAAAARPDVAEAVVAAARVVVGDVIVVGPPRSALERAARAAGLRYAAEGFSDRGYGDDGRLLPRGHPAALVAGDDEAVAARAVEMVRRQRVVAVSGAEIEAPVHTLCLHGDEPHAATRARAVRAALARAGITVAPLGAWLR